MKKFYLIIVFVLMNISVLFAQRVTEGSLSPLKGQHKVNLEFDFSQAVMHGMDEEHFRTYEEDWDEDKPEAVGLLSGEAAKRCNNNFYLGQFSNTDFSIKIIVREISTQGSFRCDGALIDKEGKQLAFFTGFHGRGGKCGSKLNLIKDGAKRTGANIGNFFNSEFKKLNH